MWLGAIGAHRYRVLSAFGVAAGPVRSGDHGAVGVDGALVGAVLGCHTTLVLYSFHNWELPVTATAVRGGGGDGLGCGHQHENRSTTIVVAYQRDSRLDPPGTGLLPPDLSWPLRPPPRPIRPHPRRRGQGPGHPIATESESTDVRRGILTLWPKRRMRDQTSDPCGRRDGCATKHLDPVAEETDARPNILILRPKRRRSEGLKASDHPT